MTTMKATCSDGVAVAPTFEMFSSNVRTASWPDGHVPGFASAYANMRFEPTLDRDASGVTVHERLDASIDAAGLRQKTPTAGDVTESMSCERAATSTGPTFSDTSPGTTNPHAVAPPPWPGGPGGPGGPLSPYGPCGPAGP